MERSNGIAVPARRKRGRFARLFDSRLRGALIVLAAGGIVGSQIAAPNKRVIQAVAGLALLMVMWNFSTLAAVWFIALMYPFPFGTSYGTSNVIFTALIFIIYLIRVNSGHMKISFDRRVRAPVILLVLSYVLSFYNIDPNSPLFRIALLNTGNFLAAALFMLMIVNMVDDERKLRTTMSIMVAATCLVIAFTLFETFFPGRTIVPAWIYTARRAEGLLLEGLRMGGPFLDYELVAEFFAINALFVLFMLIRSRRLLTRAFFAALLLLDVLLLFTTITRGAFISLAIGAAYLTFLCRRDLNFVRFVSLAATVVLLVFVIDFFVASHTLSGSLFDRLVATTFERGVVPDTRVESWSGAIERGMRYPLLGNGPGWDFARGLTTGLWPHSLYLFYFNITGLFGLAAFLFLLYRLGRTTMRGVRVSIVSSPFPEALMQILHVCFVIFVIDQIKIEYLRNDRYTFFIWMFFGLIVATANVIERNRSAAEITSAETSPRE